MWYLLMLGKAQMNNTLSFAQELKKYRCICFYPSSGTDLSNIDFFASGKMLWQERLDADRNLPPNPASDQDPDLFIHTDIIQYQEFVDGLDALPDNCGMHGTFEVVQFKELPTLDEKNRIFGNVEFSGRCFEYKLRVWNSSEIKTLIFCLLENECFVSRILLENQVRVPIIWAKNWNGSRTYGTWLANVLKPLKTRKFYSDWLCIPGQRGEPANLAVADKYPELMVNGQVRLIRNNDIHWIDEGSHGWVEEFDVKLI